MRLKMKSVGADRATEIKASLVILFFLLTFMN